MSELQKSAKRAQRRLWLNRWLAGLGWSLAAGAGVFTAAVVIERTWIAAENANGVLGLLAGALLGLTLIVSLIWMVVTRDSVTHAAARLDLAAGLKERLSSGLYCEGQADPFARAVVADAMKMTRGVAVRRLLPVEVP